MLLVQCRYNFDLQIDDIQMIFDQILIYVEILNRNTYFFRQLFKNIQEAKLYIILLLLSKMDWYNPDEDSFSVNSDNSYISSDPQNYEEQQVEQVKEGQTQSSPEKMTSEQIFELTEENVTCQICCKYALNAVICTNQKCRKLFCLTCVNNTKNSLQNKCPFCRNEPFNFESSPYAKVINSMELYCSLCKQKYVLQQEDKHYKLNCSYFHTIQCRYCEQRFKKNEIVAHTKDTHPQKIEEMIYSFYTRPQPEHDYKTLLAKNKLYLQKIDKRPRLGTTGKFYCGGKLETKCTCCNGYCGPTNGENCVQCMKLDIRKFGLPKGFLVNSSGHVCHKKGNDFVCGVRLYYEQGECSQGNTCRSCANMKKNIKRYQDLI